MAIMSVWVLGSVALAGISLSASLLVGAMPPAAVATGGSVERDTTPSQDSADARENGTPAIDTPQGMPFLIHEPWEALLQAWGG
jgi:hypothetical protein